MTGIVASAFSNQVARKKAAFEAQLRAVFSDGHVSDDEQETLKRLQAHYRLSDQQVEAMMLSAKINQPPSIKPDMTSITDNRSAYRRIKQRVYEIMDGTVPDKYSHFVEIFVALLVVANVVGIILESVPHIHESFEAEFHAFDVFSVLVFCGIRHACLVLRRKIPR